MSQNKEIRPTITIGYRRYTTLCHQEYILFLYMRLLFLLNCKTKRLSKEIFNAY